MRNLISFLAKYHFILLFLLLETVSLLLIFRTSYYQRDKMISSANAVTGRLNTWFTDVAGYLFLKEENRILAEENARLMSMIPADSAYRSGQDLAPPDTSFRFLAAKVISNSINKRNNYFMLDKGSADGLHIDMGVISSRGIAGIVVGVSENFSLAMSFLHKDARLSGRISKNNQLVNITWDGKDYRLGRVNDIPKHIELTRGDTIITSGNSLIFPEGILIGTIDEYSRDQNELFNSATLKYGTDFNSLYYVYIIENQNREELLELKSAMQN